MKRGRNRKNIRLRNFDYSSPNDYFITICSHERECIFGEVLDGKMILNESGKIVNKEIAKSALIRKEIDIDVFCIMPNHIHLIVSLNGFYYDTVGENGRSPLHFKNKGSFRMKPKSIPSFVSGFKSSATKNINIFRNIPNQPVWQRSYYEHIIRNQKSYDKIYDYIKNNPNMWNRDRNNPINLK